MVKKVIVSCILMLLWASFVVNAQTAGDYQTNSTGTWNWNNTSNWQRYNGTSWVSDGTYPGQNTGTGTVNIRNTTIVTVSADVPNAIGALRIDGGNNDSYIQFDPGRSLTVTGQTYLRSNSNDDEKSIRVGDGIFETGSLYATTGNNDRQDAYIWIIDGTVTVNGDITFISNSSRNYIRFTGTGILNIGGAFSGGGITSTDGGGASAPASGTVSYNGPVAQTLGSYTYFNLQTDNSAGVTLPGDITTTNLIMTQGNIDAGSNTLIVTGNITYNSGAVIGRVRRNISATGTDYLFPVGSSSSYNPLIIRFTNLNAGTLTVFFQSADIGTAGLPLNDGGNWIYDRQVSGYWRLVAASLLSSNNYNVNLNFSGFPDVDSRARILKRTTTGNLTLNGTHGTVSGSEITRTGLSGISTTNTDLAIGKPHPRITTHPSDFTGCSPVFTVAVSGSAPLSYQWQEDSGSGFHNISDGGIYSGTTSSSLTITGAPGIMAGWSYSCVVTDALGYSTTSNQATLNINLPAVMLGYMYMMDVILDPASGSADLTDFPALVSFTSPLLRTTANSGHVYNTNGYDIVFTDENGNRLDHQIESYSPTTGQYIAWVRIPVLSHTLSTTIKMLYGNSTISVNPSTTGVWTSSYKGVWHLNGTTFTSDATSNANNGTNNATSAVTGRIAGGRGFNGSSSYIVTPANGFVDNDNNQTISIWANYSVTPSGNANLMSFQNADEESAIQLGFRGGRAVAWKWGGTILADGGTAPTTNIWHYYTYVFDGTTSYIYIDGLLRGSSTEPPQTYAPTEGDIGRYNNGEYLAANLDEARFSMSPKSSGWIMTEYLNQNDPSSFITLGSEEETTILGSVGVCKTTYSLSQGYPAGGVYSGTGVSGTNFNPSVAGVGTHALTYTYTDGASCSNSITKYISVTPVPSAPSAGNTVCCITNISDLSASGTNLKWYSDNTLTTQVGSGTPFATGQTTAGTYTYYVTQTVNGCESVATTVILQIVSSATINTQPLPVSICSGYDATFSVSVTGYNLTYQWQENGSNLAESGIYSGVTTSTLLLTNPGSGLSGRTYRCIITTTCGTTPLTSSAAALTIVTTNQWTGNAGNDWNNILNWGCGAVPLQLSDVVIPDVVNKPVLASGSAATVRNITIASNSSLTISGNTIKISGTISNGGTFNVSAGTVEMNGTSAQQIPAAVFSGNTVKDLVVNNNAGVSLMGSLSVTGSVLVATGSLASNGNLILVSSAARTAYIDGSGAGQITGNVTMQRYLPSGYGYRYISSPFMAATVNGLSPEVNLGSSFPLVYRYDENRTSSGWVSYINPALILNPLQGYSANFGSLHDPELLDITGVVNNGPYSVTLYNHGYTYTNGMNLVGNPYPSPIDWDAASGWTKTNINDAIYFFRPGATDQYGGTYSSYVNGMSSDGFASNIIPSMQGFFVQVSSAGIPVTGILGMNNQVRVNDFSQQYAKSAAKAVSSQLRLSASFSPDTTKNDFLLIYQDDKAADTFSYMTEAIKIFNTDLAVPNIYALSSDAQKLSIRTVMPSEGEALQIPLGVKANKAGTLVFSLKTLSGSFEGNDVYLTDLTAGINQRLNNGGEYSVYLPKAEYLNRFRLDLNATTVGAEDNPAEKYELTAWYSNGILRARIETVIAGRGIIRLSNLTGHRILEEMVTDGGLYEYGVTLKSGIYILTLETGNIRMVRKFIVNR